MDSNKLLTTSEFIHTLNTYIWVIQLASEQVRKLKIKNLYRNKQVQVLTKQNLDVFPLCVLILKKR